MVYISEKGGNSGTSYITLERAWLAVYCVQVSKYELFLWAEKIFSENWNNRILLISMKTQFSSWIFQVAKRSLTNFYCFNIHALISPRKGAILGQVIVH